MDNMNPGQPASNNSDKPIPIPPYDKEQKGVSHSSLDLGSSRPVEINKVPKPQVQSQVKQAAPAVAPSVQTVSAGRISAVKTFFTKLHPGALDFIDDQINSWLKENPTVIIKMIQTAVGDVQSKKTEPNIIITIWY